MFCSNCGRPTEGDKRLCPACEAAQAAPVQPAPQAQPFYQTAPTYQPVNIQPPVIELNLSGQAPAPEKPKKKKKTLLAVIASLLAAALLFCGAGFIFWDFGGTVSYSWVKMTKDEKAAALYVEEKALEKEGIPLLSDSYGMGSDFLTSDARSSSLQLQVGEPVMELLSQYGNSGDAATVAGLLSLLQNIQLTMDTANDGDMTQADISVALNNVDLLTLRVIMDYMSGEGYIGLPDLHDVYLAFDLDNVGIDQDQLMSLFSTAQNVSGNLPDEEAFRALVNRYILTALSGLKDVDEETDTVEAGGIRQRMTVYTYKIDEAAALDMLIAVLKEAENDQELRALMEVFLDYYNSYMDQYGYYYQSMDADEFFELIPFLIEELESVEPEQNGETIYIRTYVDGSGNICGRELEVEDVHFSYLTVSKGRNRGFDLSMGSGNETVSIEGSGKETGNKLTGSYAIQYMNYSLIDIELENFNTENYTGTVRIMPSGTTAEMVNNALDNISGPLASLFQNGTPTLEIQLTETSADISLLSGSQMLLRLAVSSEEAGSQTVSVPSQYTYCYDEEDLNRWLSEIDLSELIANMEQAGLPDLLQDLLTQADFGGYAVEETDAWLY